MKLDVIFLLPLSVANNLLFVAVFSVSALIVLGLGVFFIMRHVRKQKSKIYRLEQLISEKRTDLRLKSDAGDKVLADLPVGVVMLNDKDVVIYANDQAKDVFENVLESRRITTVYPELKPYLEAGEERFMIKILETRCDIIYDALQKMLYITPVEERETLKDKYYAKTDCIGILHLDNFEDAIQVLDVKEKNVVEGKLFGALEAWADRGGYHFVPASASSIVVFMHRVDLEKAMDNGFSVSDDIKAVSNDEDLAITLSGGFACANMQLKQLGESAEDALNLALSRGGDQIVVNIQGETPRYFGANVNAREKRTRISSRINAEKLAGFISAAESVIIMPHKHPDPDALGAAIGVLKMVKALDKKGAIVIDEDELSKSVMKIFKSMEYEYVSLFEDFVSLETVLSTIDASTLLIMVDHHSVGQAVSEKLLKKTPVKAIIDHHRQLPDAVQDADMRYIEPYASSTTELIVDMLNVFKVDVEITPFEATIMYSGIVVDTNNFMVRTGSRTLEAAAILKKYGADTYKVKNLLRKSLKDIQIQAELLSMAEVYNKRFSIIVVPDKYNPDRTMLAQIADDLLDIDNTVAAFALGKISSDETGISARSLEGFNVQVIMEHFGGGGHLNNAGAQIDNDALDDVKQQLIDFLDTKVKEEKPMKVILKKDLKNKGKKGDVIDVAPGYGNYLLTSQQAIEATSENLQAIEAEKEKAAEAEQKHLEDMKQLKERLDYRAVKLYVKVGDNGKFYGKVTAKHIAEALKEQHDIDLDKRKILLEEPIAQLGAHTIDVRLHKDVTATFELLVLEA